MPFLLLISINLIFANTEVLKFSGIAKNPKGEIVYLEEHEVVYKDKKVESSKTFYLDPDSKKKIAELVSTYTPHKWVPDYYFKDLRFDKYNGIKPNKEEAEVFTKKGSEVKKKELSLKENMIGGQGFHYFVQDHLEQLSNNEKVKTKYILPGKLDYFSFVIEKSDKRNVKEDEIHLSMKLDSLLALFIDPIYMTYNLKNKNLIAYYGKSNLLDSQKEDLKVNITYNYERVAK